ncbi:HNH endonuclease [Acinetobacter sp. CFCC 10889]|uniref:HNH endonuclease n=1 Tax=Acinetobacter sp. CFCC 10889 TaxID=1775557 RepID=UPI000DD0ACE3|nr:HNH endonuclease [Acinetobacter sp. CFCC 10889]
MGNITDKNLKILWGASGNLCAFPECNIEITALSENEGYTLGEMAHIKGDKKGSCRYDPDQTDLERNSHKNLVLLCPTHHTIIDKPENLNIYTVDFLMKIKEDHLANVKAKLKVDEIFNISALKDKIAPYLTDNHTNWAEYGPLSEKARRNPHNTKLHKIWLHIRLEKIIPNNRAILELLKINRNLFKTNDQQTISDFITHVESYENWVLSDNTYETVKPFPSAFNKLICG